MFYHTYKKYLICQIEQFLCENLIIENLFKNLFLIDIFEFSIKNNIKIYIFRMFSLK